MNTFIERKNDILNVFQKAKADLDSLNKDIQLQVDQNVIAINEKVTENKELIQLQRSNEVASNNFKRFFGI